MLEINQSGFSLPQKDVRSNKQSQPQLKLKTLDKDIFVSFGLIGETTVTRRMQETKGKFKTGVLESLEEIKKHKDKDIPPFLKIISDFLRDEGDSINPKFKPSLEVLKADLKKRG